MGYIPQQQAKRQTALHQPYTRVSFDKITSQTSKYNQHLRQQKTQTQKQKTHNDKKHESPKKNQQAAYKKKYPIK